MTLYFDFNVLEEELIFDTALNCVKKYLACFSLAIHKVA